VLRFYRLTRPDVQIFDESIYVKDACFYVHAAGRPPCFDREITIVHPPLGKWLIGWGIDAAGFTPLGWRVASAIAGTLTIALLYLLARALLRSTATAAVASGLLGIDFLHFVHSRIGMLDVFVALFGVAAVLCAVYDRDRALARSGPGPPRERWSRAGWRPWRLAAGVACGLAVATKWSGLLVLATVVALTVAWEVRGRRERDGLSRRAAFNRALGEEAGSMVVGLVVVPLAVYAATFAGRLDGSLLAWPWAHGSFYRALWDRQFYMYEFHRFLVVRNWAQSPVWSWPLVVRPIPYVYAPAAASVRFVFGGGNPFVWWSSLIALVYVAARWVGRRDAGGPEGVIVAGFALGYLPWFVLTYDRQAVFTYYLLPVVPFMCLALAYALQRMWSPALVTRVAAVAAGAAAVAMFALAHPLLTAARIPESTWHARMAFYDDCAPFFDRHATLATTVGGREILTSSTLTNREARVPPHGWCGL
jgi:dolichyl-phosphate-mannose--protein O-mannosyl transferase